MSQPASSLPPWEIWVDTGGTFTDCLAREPGGKIHRAKVLSSSALRGTALGQIDSHTLLVAPQWSGHPALVATCTFRLLAGEWQSRIAEFDPAGGRLRLLDPLDDQFAPGPFEVQSPEVAPILAARLITGIGARDRLPPLRMRLATTRGTNALLERRGASVAFFVTEGFGDLLEIGTQQRPDLFSLRIQRQEPLTAKVVEVAERLTSNGSILSALDEKRAAEGARRAVAEGFRVAAIALMHSHRNSYHEQRLEELLLDAGFEHVSRSSNLSRSLNLLERAQTTVTNAYLAPVLNDYLAGVVGAMAGTVTDPLAVVGTDAVGRVVDTKALRAEVSESRPEWRAVHRGEEVDPERPAPGRASDNVIRPGSGVLVMTSAGGLLPADKFHPKDSLLSGPAAGVVGAADVGSRLGLAGVIAFDMGGTSTDVSRFDGGFEYVWRHQVAGIELLAPALSIESVAAGGGSICSFAAGALAVGPRSAGASPGPACYGAGGPLTITDCNLLLGRVCPERFGIPIFAEAAEVALEQLRKVIGESAGSAPDREELLEGLVQIANERMADAIRGISLRRGYDPADYALVVFGGAGAQHGCAVAELLGMETVVVPPDPGLLSARGLGVARMERVAFRQVLLPLEGSTALLESLIDELASEAIEALAADGVAKDRAVVVRQILDLRLTGQNATIAVDREAGVADAEVFARRYLAEFGHRPDDGKIEIESVRVIAAGPPGDPLPLELSVDSGGGSFDHRRARLAGAWVKVPLFDRGLIHPASRVEGPALIADPHSTIVVEEGWVAKVAPDASLILKTLTESRATGDARSREVGSGIAALACGEAEVRDASARQVSADIAASANGEADEITRVRERAPEIVRQQLFTSRFESLVEQMGEQLRRTALSVNVKERLDFSCALLDQSGELVANAPHIPVHLGALGVCVRAVAAALPMQAGDVVITNHPAFGGSHLPDVTVVSPVFGGSGMLLGYVANRAHHAEIGGTRPGSMPPDAGRLVEEGVVIPPMYLVRGGEPQWGAIQQLLLDAPYPTRAVHDNLADLRAQLAANIRGVDLLGQLAAAHGEDAIARYMKALTDRSERLARQALARLPSGEFRARESLDDGTPLVVSILIGDGSATFNFSGSGPVHPGNLNATPAIVRSVVLYLLRLLIDEPIPLNEGLLRPAILMIPEGFLNPMFTGDPHSDPAVVGGNTEVSQRLVEVLLKALKLSAGSQGTMNNVLWGNGRFGYYETIGGGSGAGPGFDGSSGVHTHMTNTRITDAEVLEHRYPVRVIRFGIRHGSGGAGRWRGGDGIVREVEFLEPVQVSVLTQSRLAGPFGVDGGQTGKPGRQWLQRPHGETIMLRSVDGCDAAPGDRLVVETPGGGGWGNPGAEIGR